MMRIAPLLFLKVLLASLIVIPVWAEEPVAPQAQDAPPAADEEDAQLSQAASSGERGQESEDDPHFHGNRRLGFDLGLYTTSGTRYNIRETDASTVREEHSFAGPLRPDLGFWFQSALHPRFEMGVGTRLRWDRKLGGEGSGDFERLGTALALFWILEASMPLTPGLTLQGGARIGGEVLFVANDLEDALDAIRAGGFDPWSGPRGGILVEPRVGTRYSFASAPVALRADVGIGWERYWFWVREDTVSGARLDRRSYSSALTARFSLGVEYLF